MIDSKLVRERMKEINTDAHPWYENELSKTIAFKKYAHPQETSVADIIARVSSIFTSESLQHDVMDLLIKGSFFPGGRSLYGAGSKDKFKATMSNCFLAGMKVLTTDGLKNIEDVQIGDKVITSQGPREVVNTLSRQYTGDLYKLSSRDFFGSIICTPNHQFLTPDGWVRADRMLTGSDYPSKIKRVEHSFQKQYPDIDLQSYYTTTDKERIIPLEDGWIRYEAFDDEISIWGHYTPIKRTIQMTEDFRYFIGNWLANGSVIRKKNSFEFNHLQMVFDMATEKEIASKCINIGTEAFGIIPSVYSMDQKSMVVVWDNPIIGNFFYKEFGSTCDDKYIKPMYLGDAYMALGLADSSNCTSDSDKGTNITSTNFQLISWLRTTLQMNGIPTVVNTVKINNTVMGLNLYISSALSKKYVLPYLTRVNKNNVDTEQDHSDSDWATLEKIEVLENQDTTVYNLSVDDVHEYSVNGVIAKNCYVMPSPQDSLDGIYESNREIAKIFKSGGGIGVNLSTLRPNGAKTNNAARTSTGAVSFMHLYNTTGSIIGFHGRRGATIIGLNINHPDIEEFIELRTKAEMSAMNISCVVTDEFMRAVELDTDFDLEFHVEDTGEHIKKTVRARDLFKRICEVNWDYGDPGFMYIDAVRRNNLMSAHPNFKIDISNPCLAGYTRILTDKGYFPIESLVGQEVNIWNGYRYSKVVPRITGYNQKMVRVTLSNGSMIDCTLYHKFIMEDGSRKEAKDLQPNEALCRWYAIPIEGYKQVDRRVMYTHGFYSGDGWGTGNDAHIALYNQKKNLLGLLNYTSINEQASTNKSGGTRICAKLVEDTVIPYNKTWVPDASYTIESRLWWLAGLIDSDGTLNSKEGSITISSINYGFLHDIQLMLNTLGVQSSVALMSEAGMRSLPANDGTGEYKEYYCQTAYRLLIAASYVRELLRLGLQTFRVSTLPTPNPGYSRYVRVVSVEPIPDAAVVYCFTEPYNNSMVAEGVMINQCNEYSGPAYNSCNLGSLNLYNYVKNKFTDDAYFDKEEFKKDISTSIRALDEILDYGYDMQPLDQNRDIIDKWRSIGLGFFGLADALIALKIRYGSEDSWDFAREVSSMLMNTSVMTSSLLAKEKGSFGEYNYEYISESGFFRRVLDPEVKESVKQYGLRNAQFISVAPTGSLSLLAGQLSSGVEPIFKCTYERSTHSLESSGVSFAVADKAINDLLEFHNIQPGSLSSEDIKKRFDWVVEASDVPYQDRIAVQASIQGEIDNAISSTVNLPESATVEDIWKIYMRAWELGLKGITVFRDNCKRASILGFSSKNIKEEDTNKPVVVESEEIIMDSVEPLSRKDKGPLNGRTYRKQTACVRALYVTINRDEDGHIFEVFTNKSVHGCSANIATITRMTSLALRSGISVKKIIEELKENACQACQTAYRKNKNISMSCPIAIAEALEEEYKHTIEHTHEPQYETNFIEEEHTPQQTKQKDKASNTSSFTPLECPICHERTLIVEGKCETCKRCGYSKCD